MISDRLDEILLSITEDGDSFGRAQGAGNVVDWCAIANIHKRIVLTIFQQLPMNSLTQDEFIDGWNHLNIVVGTKAADKVDIGLFSYELLLVLDDSGRSVFGRDSDGDQIIR